MADKLDRPHFIYEDIELFKSENLGAGSYGVVCKAKCNNLLCAAKIIYPILFEVQDDSSSLLPSTHFSPLQRFEQECQFLKQINHPCIVQYLQTYRDPDTGSSILLMELMDESLTHFLQMSQSSVPFHVRVSICHCVALALSFLHSNGIIHRDLSSNNILVNDGIRAKVTDFGMSMFSDAMGSRTLCPGTVAYMPPEALNDPPIHTNKMDCFSLGACLVQICTRLWPDPKPRFSTYQVQDPRDPSKTTEAQISVPEVERRASHIELIDSADLLLPIALACLKDDREDRPSAAELCVRIETLKERQEFGESLAATNRSDTADDRLLELDTRYANQQSLLENEMQRLRATVDEAHEDIREKNQMLDIRARQLQKVTRSLAEKERENDRLRTSITNEGNSKMVQNEIIEALEKELDEKGRENTRLQQQLELQDQTIRDQRYITKNDDYQLRNMQFDLTAKVELIQRLTQQLDQATALLSEKERMLLSKKREVRHLEELLQTKMYSFQETLRAREKRIEDLEEYLATNEEHVSALQKELRKIDKVETKVLEKKKIKPKPAPRFKKDGAFHVYKSDHSAPVKMHAGSTASIGSCVFVRPYDSKAVFKFNSDTSHWSSLPEYVDSAFTLAKIQSTLTAVGGRGSRKVRCFIENNGKQDWVESYPEMMDERASACAVSNEEVLVVAGGLKSDYSTISSVEVLRFHTSSWNMVASLPYALHAGCATICGDRIYLGGGYYMKSRSLYSILTCSLPNLLSSSAQKARAASLPHDFRKKDWYHISDLPLSRSSFTSFHGELIAIGGKYDNGLYSNMIYKYSLVNDRWEEVSRMDKGRSNCLVGNLSTKIIIVGGYCEEGISSQVEYITV